MNLLKSNKNKYLSNYDTLSRFISYHTQITLIKELKSDNILEIGVGNKTVSNYLITQGLEVTTLDIDKTLNPDIVGDVRKIPLKDNSFNVITAFEILEHIPHKDVSKAVKEIARVTKKHAIISVPHPSAAFELILKVPFLGIIADKTFFRLFFEFPYKFINFTLTKEHYWELGTKKADVNDFRNILRKYFKVTKEVRPLLNSYHHFFVLSKL